MCYDASEFYHYTDKQGEHTSTDIFTSNTCKECVTGIAVLFIDRCTKCWSMNLKVPQKSI